MSTRWPKPTLNANLVFMQVVTVLNLVSRKEGILLPEELARRIATQSHRNLRRAVLTLEACRVQKYVALDQLLGPLISTLCTHLKNLVKELVFAGNSFYGREKFNCYINMNWRKHVSLNFDRYEIFPRVKKLFCPSYL